jgi:sn-glycerol 3-phosphate transport system ATP-binding protein
MAEIAFDHVTKEFPGGTVALDDLTLEIPDGQFLILVGPSGCGKTTALRIVAGLEKPTSGVIAIGGEAMNQVSPRDRDIAMVFQNYALYPHMSVYRNLAFGLKERHTPKPEIDRRVREASAILGLDELLKRRPAQLSGGQRQRVAMGRALVREPKAFLLDEPLSNLDAKLRVQMRAELKRIHQRLGITTVYVTHDQVEAMTLGDRIVVMSGGKALQIGRPQDVYRNPVNLFVAGFIGSPAMNLVRGTASERDVVAGELTFPRAGVPVQDVVVGIRPECLTPVDDGRPALEFRVDVVEPLGEQVVVHGTVAGTPVHSGAEEEGAEIPVLVEGARAPMTAIFAADREPVPGDVLRLGVLPERIHLFDQRSGEALPGAGRAGV